MGALERLGHVASAAGDVSSAQTQTEEAFGFKWARRDTYESAAVQETVREWLFDRYCGGDPAVLDGWLAGGRKLILDAGCGAGHAALLFFGERLREHDYLGLDISSAVQVARARFAERGIPGEFLRADLTTIDLPPGSVDLIFSEGVLHHTDDTGRAMRHLSRALAPGGRFAFYVYVKKAVLREFSDDHIRDALRPLSDEEAWTALEPLTKLGIALGKLGVTLDVPEDIPYLGIKKGPIDLQRFFYWNVAKLYYRPDWTLDEMNHINFDWYRPLNCHRHTPEEVEGWCREAGLEIERLKVEDAGITVVARRPR
ncbi:MAG TPA: class I SAM-dependent methyltransferase [Gemmatimonadaceae bacterium]|nr:class I SAM-dependent methyltransferase [Gemmatimonadaceae bacterium]